SPEAESNAEIRARLDDAFTEVMGRLRAAPDTYVMRPDEFSLSNYFQHRFDRKDKMIMGARKRYWQCTTA
ncbi:hypothetical protein B0T24DRAFT_535108, partial [Lasiosphaeria ovina]